ncbi:hypothetical protein C1645_823096 [Glomus cerebriforme]|uniref:Uncharacterized protein n=1 Tax=Glomus cerebriforme TaxID=658196 RepID=A0A397T6J4_9GLOM|nr:hypothetical protein C1645_823096 [Glomus cerebriforme]
MVGHIKENFIQKQSGRKPHEYECRVEEFNISQCWEWKNNNVLIYELPSEPHEICIGAFLRANESFPRTDAEIYGLGHMTVVQKMKLMIHLDIKNFPWPNIIIEVAYFESVDNVTIRVKEYWLQPDRVHDAIVVKIDPVLKAWHYCISDRVTRNILPTRTIVMSKCSETFSINSN